MSYPRLIKGISCLSIVTSDPALFEQAIAFYQQFGFISIHSFDHAFPSLEPSTSHHALHALDSLKEVWLNAQPDVDYDDDDDDDGNVVAESYGVTLKVRLTLSGPTAQNATEKAKSFFTETGKALDWRAIAPSFVFKTPDLETVLITLEKYQVIEGVTPYIQPRPTSVSPVEVFGLDPLGNIIGFTTRENPFSVVDKPFISTRNKEASLSGITSRASSVTGNGLKDAFSRRRIAILTSGGDAPGMNAAVRAVVRTAIYRGCEAYAIMEGYEGLLQGGKYIKEMSWDDVRGWLAIGGTHIGTARCAGFRERAGRLIAAKNMVLNGIDALIVCGGDGSLTGADKFREEWPSLLAELVEKKELTPEQVKPHEHLYICGLVGSIDNDMAHTDSTIGAHSSLERICEAVDYIDATAQSHSRAFVIEVMGRHCGWLGLMAGIATGADFLFIPERPPNPAEWQAQMCKIVSRHRANGQRKTIVIVAEGAIDTNLDAITPEMVKNVLVELGLDTRITTLGHVQRGGNAVAADRALATLQGVDAVDAVLSATPDTPSPMIGIVQNKIVRRNLVEAVAATLEVAKAIKDKDFDKAMSLRDSEFAEHYQNFLTINHADREGAKNPADKPLNIAVVNIGAPAGGMNSAIRAMAAYCYSRGHKPFAIHNGWTGLARHESVHPLSWLEVEEWMIRGGCEIGTNRNLPETDIGMIAYYFQKYRFDGLIIIGGFEAFASLQQLEAARPSYPAFRIPMVCIPATISNNVPGTEYSLGTDTCLNALVTYCDVIKQSASASRRRVFVVEVQGGNSGYIAAYAGLVTGAHAIYLPEEGITLRQLEADIDHLKESFERDGGMNRAGKLILRNERSSNTLSTEIITNIIRDEADGAFDSRTAIPGHVQQGGNPSPMDRVRATRFAIQACQFIERLCKQHQKESDQLAKNAVTTSTSISSNSSQQHAAADSFSAVFAKRSAAPKSAAVLGVRSSKLVFSPIDQLWAYETEHKERRPKKVHWLNMARTADRLVGRVKVDATKL